MNNDATADSMGKIPSTKRYISLALYLRRPTICIELGNFQDRFEIPPTEGIAQEITVIIEYNTSQVYAILLENGSI
jgi:hypothetical protein